MNFEELHTLVAAYALDALDGAERAEFELHLAGCDDCRNELAEFGPVVAELAAATAATPPPALRDAVLSRIGQVEQDRPADVVEPAPVTDLAERRRRRFSAATVLSAAAAVALVAVGALVVVGNRGGSDFDDVVAAPDAQVVELAVQVEGEPGNFEVVWSPERDQVALRGIGVDDLDPELRYALWAIADGTPIPAGLFDAEGGQIAEVADLDIDSVQAWGVTVEPAEGSDVPTPPIIFLAEA